MPENQLNAPNPEEDPPADPLDPNLSEPDDACWDAFLPDDESEPLPEWGDFWIEQEGPEPVSSLSKEGTKQAESTIEPNLLGDSNPPPCIFGNRPP